MHYHGCQHEMLAERMQVQSVETLVSEVTSWLTSASAATIHGTAGASGATMNNDPWHAQHDCLEVELTSELEDDAPDPSTQPISGPGNSLRLRFIPSSRRGQGRPGRRGRGRRWRCAGRRAAARGGWRRCPCPPRGTRGTPTARASRPPDPAPCARSPPLSPPPPPPPPPSAVPPPKQRPGSAGTRRRRPGSRERSPPSRRLGSGDQTSRAAEIFLGFFFFFCRAFVTSVFELDFDFDFDTHDRGGEGCRDMCFKSMTSEP